MTEVPETHLIAYAYGWVQDNIAIHFTARPAGSKSDNTNPTVGINVIYQDADLHEAFTIMGNHHKYLSDLVDRINRDVYIALMNDLYAKTSIRAEVERYTTISDLDARYLEWRLDRLLNDPAITAVAYNALAESLGT
ncbi:MAG: hypothetical protein NC489_08285 [Ruminococcus flavefaciens]|nr:hypothetical protein [Ruminococcus flavefaciens]